MDPIELLKLPHRLLKLYISLTFIYPESSINLGVLCIVSYLNTVVMRGDTYYCKTVLSGIQ